MSHPMLAERGTRAGRQTSGVGRRHALRLRPPAAPGSTPAAPSSRRQPSAALPGGASRSSATARGGGRRPSRSQRPTRPRPLRPHVRWRARRGGKCGASRAPEPLAGLGRLGQAHRDGKVGGRGAIPLAPTMNIRSIMRPRRADSRSNGRRRLPIPPVASRSKQRGLDPTDLNVPSLAICAHSETRPPGDRISGSGIDGHFSHPPVLRAHQQQYDPQQPGRQVCHERRHVAGREESEDDDPADGDSEPAYEDGQ